MRMQSPRRSPRRHSGSDIGSDVASADRSFGRQSSQWYPGRDSMTDDSESEFSDSATSLATAVIPVRHRVFHRDVAGLDWVASHDNPSTEPEPSGDAPYMQSVRHRSTPSALAPNRDMLNEYRPQDHPADTLPGPNRLFPVGRQVNSSGSTTISSISPHMRRLTDLGTRGFRGVGQGRRTNATPIYALIRGPQTSSSVPSASGDVSQNTNVPHIGSYPETADNASLSPDILAHRPSCIHSAPEVSNFEPSGEQSVGQLTDKVWRLFSWRDRSCIAFLNSRHPTVLVSSTKVRNEPCFRSVVIFVCFAR